MGKRRIIRHFAYVVNSSYEFVGRWKLCGMYCILLRGCNGAKTWQNCLFGLLVIEATGVAKMQVMRHQI